jgi:hypothetical protein
MKLDHLIFNSSRLNATEQRYSTFSREALNMIKAIRGHKHSLLGMLLKQGRWISIRQSGFMSRDSWIPDRWTASASYSIVPSKYHRNGQLWLTMKTSAPLNPIAFLAQGDLLARILRRAMHWDTRQSAHRSKLQQSTMLEDSVIWPLPDSNSLFYSRIHV